MINYNIAVSSQITTLIFLFIVINEHRILLQRSKKYLRKILFENKIYIPCRTKKDYIYFTLKSGEA